MPGTLSKAGQIRAVFVSSTSLPRTVVRDKTVSYLHVDKGSMHVVQHHMIYSPERKHIIAQGFTLLV
jgi:hypothetical protein